jgi:DNA end-binding protein Ku
MAPRANWKGFLRLSLVTCPVALYPATSDSEKISFNINRKTGHRIKYARVDGDTGEEVSNDDIMKGYKVDTDTYIEVSKDELENIALESTRTIDINEFVPKADIDPRYLIRPYYLVPDGKVGHYAFAVIRETIRSMNMVAIGRVVLPTRQCKAAALQKNSFSRHPSGCPPDSDKKCYNAADGVHHQLPSIGKMKYESSYQPATDKPRG